MSEEIQRLLDASNCFIAANIAGEIHLLQKEITRLQGIVEGWRSVFIDIQNEIAEYPNERLSYGILGRWVEQALSLTATKKETKE